MKHYVAAVIVLLASFAVAADNVAGPIKVLDTKWRDEARKRDVRARIYYPAETTAAVPVIVFSHGLGASRVMYSYLGKHWASHGFVSVHVQHIGSDDALAKGKEPMEVIGIMLKAVHNDDNLVNRPLDVSFAIDQLTKENVADASPLKGKLDLNRIGVAGHSFGAYTTLAIAGGQVTAHGVTKQYTDPRVKAAIAMSAPSTMGRVNMPVDQIYADIKIPIMHLTGTKDTIPIVQNSGPEDRRVPFDRIVNADQYLITFVDGDHIVLCGERVFGIAGPNDPQIVALTCQTTVAFWNAYLNNDARAAAWMSDGEMKTTLGAIGILESKRAHVK